MDPQARIRELKRENNQLRAECARLSMNPQTRIEELERENDQLRAEMARRGHQGTNQIMAQILQNDPFCNELKRRNHVLHQRLHRSSETAQLLERTIQLLERTISVKDELIERMEYVESAGRAENDVLIRNSNRLEEEWAETNKQMRLQFDELLALQRHNRQKYEVLRDMAQDFHITGTAIADHVLREKSRITSAKISAEDTQQDLGGRILKLTDKMVHWKEQLGSILEASDKEHANAHSKFLADHLEQLYKEDDDLLSDTEDGDPLSDTEDGDPLSDTEDGDPLSDTEEGGPPSDKEDGGVL
ncbi:hypothetical protein OPT61_g3766 [Boeremia exigua]|uniref:Uncharacterized protein n=1 Tax=Boeremia exigua TaxID=749465 RepID=A0ACC2IGM8_9PLEO|nr:hypothetical protein OPT61_g3766 [Boeremia exigua]